MIAAKATWPVIAKRIGVGIGTARRYAQATGLYTPAGRRTVDDV
jgi:hypothetical protein